MVDEQTSRQSVLDGPAELAIKFLSLYDCLTYPEHTELLIETIGNWLAEEDITDHIKMLEQRAETVLKLSASMLDDRQKNAKADRNPNFSVPLGAREAVNVKEIESALGISFVAQDVRRLGRWAKSSDVSKVFRVVDQNEIGRLCLANKTVTLNGETVVQFWMNDAAIAQAAEAMLVRDLGISHSETLVLREMAMGKRRSEIAKKLGKSQETARSQIKSIANKMGVSGQIEIAAELRSLELLGLKAPKPQGAGTSDLQHIHLPDGRTLEYMEYGPKSGRPTLFFRCFFARQAFACLY